MVKCIFYHYKVMPIWKIFHFSAFFPQHFLIFFHEMSMSSFLTGNEILSMFTYQVALHCFYYLVLTFAYLVAHSSKIEYAVSSRYDSNGQTLTIQIFAILGHTFRTHSVFWPPPPCMPQHAFCGPPLECARILPPPACVLNVCPIVPVNNA